MSPLEFVKPSEDPNVNVLLYGPPGSGKTVGAASAPGPVLYLNADRPNATRFAHRLHGEKLKEVHVEGLTTLVEATLELERGDYSTVVLDTVAETYLAVIEDLSGRRLSPHLDEYRDAGTHLERFIRKCCELPLNAVFVAHEMVVEETGGGAERVPFVTTSSGSPVFAAKVMALVDIVGYCGVVIEEGRDPAYLATLVDARGRRGKDRFNALGISHRLDLTEWVKLAREAETNQAAIPVAAKK